ncbi:MAG: hypothetical protein AAF517_24195, partial [Planctomycetota bacterium]
VGAMWNPGNTTDRAESGSVHYLIPPKDRTKPWQPVALPHEPTVHRMRWVKAESKFYLVVLPLHGVGNRRGKGDGVKCFAYEAPSDTKSAWTKHLVDDTLHVSHNLDVVWGEKSDLVVLGGREGLVGMIAGNDEKRRFKPEGMKNGVGEIRVGKTGSEDRRLVATVEPFHGNTLVSYLVPSGDPSSENWKRAVLDSDLSQGHAVACADLLGLGRDQVVAGWRGRNSKGKVGIKLYVPNEDYSKWESHTIDDNTMACEDLRVGDLNGDGKPDIVGAGRATKNLVIYWNQRGK